MAVEFLDAGTIDFNGVFSDTYTLTLPVGTLPGDLFVLQLAIDAASASVTSTPSGVQVLVAYSAATSGTCAAASWLWVTPSTVPGSITFTISAAEEGTLAWARFRGVDPANPFAADVGVRPFSGSIATSFVAPAVTTTAADAFVIGGLNTTSGSAVVGVPSGWTLRTDAAKRDGALATKGVQATSGSTGTATFTTSGGTRRAQAWQTALRPGAALPDPITAAPSGIATAVVLGAAAVVLAALTVGPVGITSAAAMGTPAVSVEVGTAIPAGIASSAAVGTPAVTSTLTTSPVSVAAAYAVGSPAVWVLPPSGPVPATDETEPFASGTGDIADDPAIWVNTADPAASVVVGSKKAAAGGGLAVYNLDGTEHQFLSAGELNNVDVRDGVLGGRVLVVATDRTTSALAFFWLDRATRLLSTAGSTLVGFEPYGCCLYVSPVDAKVYAFVTSNASPSQIDQYELTVAGDTVSGAKVRDMSASTLCEGCAADDDAGWLFLTEEDAGLYRYNAEPGGGSSRVTIDTTSGHLTADAEGVAIARGRMGDPGYIIVSSQGASTYQVYDLAAPHAWRKQFTVVASGGVDGTSDTDGIDITRADLSPLYPHGLFVAHDAVNTGSATSNFKLIDAGPILGTYATTWDIAAAPAGIASTATTGDPAVTTSLTASPSGIGSVAVAGTPALSGVLTATPAGVASAAAVGDPVVSTTLTVAPGGIASAAALGTPLVTIGADLSPAGIPSGAALGTPTITATLTASPEGIATSAAVGAPDVTQGAPGANLTPTGITSAATVGTPTITPGAVTLSPVGILSVAVVGTPSTGVITRDLTITLTGPTAHPLRITGPVTRPLAVTGPTRHPLTVTGPRS